jgi:catechol 2,3-dioxygenase
MMVHMAKPVRKIDSRVEVGRVQLAISDLDRSLAFYEGVLGFAVARRAGRAALLTAGGGHLHIELRARDGGASPAAGPPAPFRFALRYPNRPALAEALRRVTDATIPLEGTEDTGVSVELVVRDPDGHAVALYYQRPREEWQEPAEGGTPASVPVDLDALRAVVEGQERGEPDRAQPAEGAVLSDATRTRLADMRMRLLNLHKVLIDDAKVAYEMDRGRVGSNASLLQLVINDPWFAWLHPLSELVVRIDETLRADVAATEADGTVLLEQVTRLLSPELGPDEFARRYYEALQRQPAVIMAHAEVRRILKQL